MGMGTPHLAQVGVLPLIQAVTLRVGRGQEVGRPRRDEEVVGEAAQRRELIGATFGSAAWVQARRGHVAIDALSAVLPPSADRVRRWLADVLSLLFVAFFAWKSWQLTLAAIDEGQTTPSSWGPPLWIPYGCMTAGMALLALQLLLQILAFQQAPPRPAHLAPSP